MRDRLRRFYRRSREIWLVLLYGPSPAKEWRRAMDALADAALERRKR